MRVTDWEILKGFVASGVEPRGIEFVSDFYDNYKKIYDQEFEKNGYFKIIKDLLFIFVKNKKVIS